jgi:hypothetical protein
MKPPIPVLVDAESTIARESFAPLRALPALRRFHSAEEVRAYLNNRSAPQGPRNSVLLALVKAARAGSALALALLLACFGGYLKAWAIRLYPGEELARTVGDFAAAFSLAVLEGLQLDTRHARVERALCSAAMRAFDRVRHTDREHAPTLRRLTQALQTHSLGELATDPGDGAEERFEARGALALATRAGVVTDGEAAILAEANSGRAHRELAAEAGTNAVAYRQKLARVRRAVRARMARQGAVAAGPACVAVGATKGGPRGGEATHTLKAVKGAV